MTEERDLIRWCQDAVSAAVEMHPEDRERLNDLRMLLADPPGSLTDRRTLPGHLTASGIVFDPRDRFVLLLHHKALDRWLQPGGHIDPGELPLEAARREVFEELGVTVGAASSPIAGRILPVDIDSHFIPASAKKGEPAHTHHDFRFAFAMDRSSHSLNLQAAEVVDAAWMSVDDPRFPKDLARCIERALDVRLFVVHEEPRTK